jgi:hypothetical protein
MSGDTVDIASKSFWTANSSTTTARNLSTFKTYYFWERLPEDRYAKKAVIITSQLPVAKWRENINEKKVADAILDRLTAQAHRIELKGEREGLLLCWHFIFVSRQQEPIEKLRLKLKTNAQKNSVRRKLVDCYSNAECYSVRQHSSKHVGGRCSVSDKRCLHILVSLYALNPFSS